MLSSKQRGMKSYHSIIIIQSYQVEHSWASIYFVLLSYQNVTLISDLSNQYVPEIKNILSMQMV